MSGAQDIYEWDLCASRIGKITCTAFDLTAALSRVGIGWSPIHPADR